MRQKRSRIEQFRKIVDEGQYGKVDGVSIDLFSASAVVAVYNALSAENQTKYEALSPLKMVTLAFKFVK